MRAIRKNQYQRTRQGALDLNAYLLNQISQEPELLNAQELDLLYLNLRKLVDQANTAFAIQRSSALDINPAAITQDPIKAQPLLGTLTQIESQLHEDLLRQRKKTASVQILPNFVIQIQL